MRRCLSRHRESLTGALLGRAVDQREIGDGLPGLRDQRQTAATFATKWSDGPTLVCAGWPNSRPFITP